MNGNIKRNDLSSFCHFSSVFAEKYHLLNLEISWHEKTWLLQANNKGADQPAHMRSLISAFVTCSLKSIAKHATWKGSIF